jgi:Zn-dependent protease
VTESGADEPLGDPLRPPVGDPWQLPQQPPVSQPVPELHAYPTVRERLKKFFAPLIAAGAAIAKFGVILFKIKSFVFFGSFAVSFLAYAKLWGWKYGLGLILLLLVHELGHVFALRARGIKANGLVFVPLLGALTSWHQHEAREPYEDAETAIAGPLAGTIGALVVLYFAHRDHSGMLHSLAFTGMFLTIFNLVPVQPLDGGKVLHLLNPWVWVVGFLGLAGYAWYRPGVLVIILLALSAYGLYHQVRDPHGDFARVRSVVTPNQRAWVTATFLVLVAVCLLGMHASYIPRHLNGTVR